VGKRIRLVDLLDRGLLKPGAELVWERRSTGVVRAIVTERGSIRLDTGKEYDTPSGAATAVSGSILNGWPAWKHAASGKTLAELRDSVS
jgi:hypothetical protein